MSNKNFKNQNRRNYNQYANNPESEQVKEETVEKVIEPVEETVEKVIEPVEETVEEVIEPAEETVEEAVEEVTEVEEKPTEVAFGKVNCSKLNVRKEPSINSVPLCIIEHGTRMEISEFNGEWVKILTSDGVSGYCMREFIDLD